MRPEAACAGAGFVSRLIAFSLDLIVLTLGFSLALLIAGALETFLRSYLGARVHATALFAAAAPTIAAAYYVILWSFSGQTVGKWVMGLRVVGADGQPPPLGRAMIRFAGYLLSAAPLYLGFVWVLFDDDRRAWHDRLARTWVIYDRYRE